MKIAFAFRLVAIAIAIAGIADPVITRAVPITQPLTIAILDTPSLDLPDGTSTRRARTVSVAASLQASLRDAYSVTTHIQPAHVDAAACPTGAACVLISDGSSPHRMVSSSSGSDQPFLAGVRVGKDASPNIAISRVDAPSTTDLFSVSTIAVAMRAVGAVAPTSIVQVFDGQTLVGSAKHDWQPSSTSDARLLIDWTPLAAGLRKVRVVVGAFAGEATTLDNEVHVAVDVREQRAEILVVEPQPTWAATFVRRALERDPRFMVHARTRPGGSVTLTSGPAVASRGLETSTAAVIVVGAPEALSSGDVDALERFARYRGGSVIVIPSQRVTGHGARLMPSEVVERRLAEPTSFGHLRATEILTFGARAGTTVIASADRPVVVSQAVGRGRIITSGALDAWRYRGQTHDAFWSSLVADAAAATPAPLEITLSPRLMKPGEQSALSVEWNSVRSNTSEAEAHATLTCGEQGRPITLWPAGRPGMFHATVDTDLEGECRVDVLLAKPERLTASASLLINAGARRPLAPRGDLRHAVASHGGITTDAGDERVIVDALREHANRVRQLSPTRPMRSLWWMAPFSFALAAEWWLRRRRGLR